MPLISSENPVWRNLAGAALLLLLSPVIILMMMVALVLPVARPIEMTAEEVAATLRAIINGKGHDWAFDDFTSMPIADPQLESIRVRAESMRSWDVGVLQELLSEAEALAAAAVPNPERGSALPAPRSPPAVHPVSKSVRD